MRVENDTAWLNQAKIAELFGVQRPAITKHLKNIFKSGKLQEDSVSSILEHTADDAKTYKTKFYNLDAIISLGYSVNSVTATHFLRWATARLREYILKGFNMDEARIKESGGGNYWKELLDRIRDILSSEKILTSTLMKMLITTGILLISQDMSFLDSDYLRFRLKRIKSARKMARINTSTSNCPPRAIRVLAVSNVPFGGSARPSNARNEE